MERRSFCSMFREFPVRKDDKKESARKPYSRIEEEQIWKMRKENEQLEARDEHKKGENEVMNN